MKKVNKSPLSHQQDIECRKNLKAAHHYQQMHIAHSLLLARFLTYGAAVAQSDGCVCGAPIYFSPLLLHLIKIEWRDKERIYIGLL